MLQFQEQLLITALWYCGLVRLITLLLHLASQCIEPLEYGFEFDLFVVLLLLELGFQANIFLDEFELFGAIGFNGFVETLNLLVLNLVDLLKFLDVEPE